MSSSGSWARTPWEMRSLCLGGNLLGPLINEMLLLPLPPTHFHFHFTCGTQHCDPEPGCK